MKNNPRLSAPSWENAAMLRIGIVFLLSVYSERAGSAINLRLKSEKAAVAALPDLQ